MYALRVQINDELPVIAGAHDLSVLTAGVTGMGTMGQSSQVLVHPENDSLFFFDVSGLTDRPPGIENEHLYWLANRVMRVGDKVTIEVIETRLPAPPCKSTPAR